MTERDLCQDFPGDEILIDGLHAMQIHFWNNNVRIDIPVVRVMNTAHFIAAYMFSTECSGDQLEYEVIASDSYGRERTLVPLTMIVLAAMLKRTKGIRARQCRNLILENRNPDFEEGVTLYDRFLRSAEERFAEEDFLIDIHNQIIKLKEECNQLICDNIRLRYEIATMEKEIQNNQYNNCVIYNAPVYNSTSTTNNYYAKAIQTEDVEPIAEPTENPIDSIIFTPKARREHKEALIIQSLTKAIAGRKDKTRAFVQELKSWQESEYVDAHFNAQVMFDELSKILPIPFGYEVFKKHYNNTRA